jgi:1-phosphofructokinase
MIITVTMNPALDKTVHVSGFTIDAVNRTESIRLDAGGKGVNVAKVIRSLGLDCTAMGFLSGRSGEYVEEHLRGLGVNCDFVYTPGETRTNMKIIDSHEHTYTDLNEPGPEASAQALDELEKRLLQKVTFGDLVVFSGSVPPNIEKNIYGTWIALLKRMGVDTILDADGELFRKGIIAGPGAIKPNVHELEMLCRMPLETPEEIRREAEKLLAYGIDSILVSMGEKGALFLRDKQMLFASGVDTNVQSTVGAGDAMVAALAISRQRGDSPEDTLCLACACGTACVMTEGTLPPSPDTVQHLLAEVGTDMQTRSI